MDIGFKVLDGFDEVFIPARHFIGGRNCLTRPFFKPSAFSSILMTKSAIVKKYRYKEFIVWD